MIDVPTLAQAELLAAIERALSADPDVGAAWLAGSLGAGGGDAWSDVDVLVLVLVGANAGGVAVRYAADLSPIAEVVLVNTIGGRVVSAVTRDWQRFDLTFIEGAELARYDRARLSPLFNRSGSEPPVSNHPAHRTRPDTLRAMVNEFLRVFGLLVVGINRGEYQLGLSAVDILRRLTMDVMLEENGIGPVERGGLLHRNALLTPEQRAALGAIAPVVATREGIIAAELAIAAVFLPRARRLAARIDMAWPQALEDATRAYLGNHLGITFA